MALTNEELLSKVKKALGITGTYQDETLLIYIDEVKDFMLCAGVKKEIVEDSVAVGAICRGVSDLWNYGSGNTELSQYFMQRVSQLAFSTVNSKEESNG